MDRCFFKLTLRNDYLEFSFWTVTFKTNQSAILQKSQSLSNQSFKHNSTHMPSLNLAPNLSFEPTFRMFIINVYYKKSKRLLSLDSMFHLHTFILNLIMQILTTKYEKLIFHVGFIAVTEIKYLKSNICFPSTEGGGCRFIKMHCISTAIMGLWELPT